MKTKTLLLCLLMSNLALADQISTGITETTGYAQTIGLSVCGLGGVIGAIMLSFNNESGSSWIAKALMGASAIGAMPFLVEAIGEFFKVG